MRVAKARILCVDDDLDTCEMMTTLLGLSGYEVAHAQTVADGERLAKQDGFDLVLLDWNFPDGTGIELCRRIRASNAEVPVLFLTGEAQDGEIKQAISAGAQGYLLKPVNTEDLLWVVSGSVGADDGKGQQQ